MKLYCGPCLLNNRPEEIENCYKTAERLSYIDKDIRFRCKTWGGGTTPEKYVEGIGNKGFHVINNVKDTYKLKTGIEIRDSNQLADHPDAIDKCTNFIWIAARSAQNYELLCQANWYLDNSDAEEVLIKRHPGMTVDEIIGIHDICEKRHGYKPVIVERGINTFCRTDNRRWMPDFQGMLRIIQERPDIELCFDPSHACGQYEDIFPMVKAAVAIGVKNFMLEVMDDPSLSQTDKRQILNIEEFQLIYDYIKENA